MHHFPVSYDAIKRLVKGAASETRTARSIMRRSGFRPGGGEGQQALPEGPILTVPDCVYAGGCPRPPLPLYLQDHTEGDIDDFYAAVLAAEAGDPDALLEVRDRIDDFGFGFPPSRDEPFTALMRGGCPIEFDLERSGSTFIVTAVRMNGRRGPLAPGTYHHPLDLAGFGTRFDLSGCSSVQAQATVYEGTAGATLYPVFASSAADLMSGNYDYLLGGISCDTAGCFRTPWQAIPEAARADVVVAFVMKVSEESVLFSMGQAEIRGKGVLDFDATCTPLNSVALGLTSPGLLTLESGQYYGDWKAADTHFGHTKAEVEGWVASVLNDPDGWSQAGITFRNTESAPVVFEVVEEAACPGETDLGCTQPNYFGAATARVTLEASRFGAFKIVNHEAAHAFFGATHTGDGVMNTPGHPELDTPSTCDIASVTTWLSA